MRILIIEDDKEIIEALSLTFEIIWPKADFILTHLGEKGIELTESEAPDIIILDLGLPDISGFEVLKQIRLFSTIPIIILTVAAEEVDIVKGLQYGADDYIIKPFKQMELLARVKNVMRREGTLAEKPPLVCGKLYFDPSTGKVFYRGKEISLTTMEGEILYQLMGRAGHIVTQSSLAKMIWNDDYPGMISALRVHIRHLRGKLEEDPNKPQLILTRVGQGYLLAKPI